MDKINTEDAEAFKQNFLEEIPAFLQYKLVQTPDPLLQMKNNDVFSLLIIKISPLGEEEHTFIYDVTRDIRKADLILEALCRFTVTPCTAREILQEMI